MSAEEAKKAKLLKGAGCGNCAETGFKGRIAVYEVMVLSETLRDFILNGATSAEIKKQAIREGMKTLRRSGLDKLAEGTTTLKEVHRVSVSDR